LPIVTMIWDAFLYLSEFLSLFSIERLNFLSPNYFSFFNPLSSEWLAKFIDYFESIYSDKYICDTELNITTLIENIEDTYKIYKNPDLIKNRQEDLIETCPFIDNNLKNILYQRLQK
jgi:hypothetical protein